MALITGTSGNDTLSGDGNRLTAEDFQIQGLDGDDTISAGFGADSLEGGAGDDYFGFERGSKYLPRIDGKITPTWADDEKPDTYDGGDGIDTLGLIIFGTEEDTHGLRPFVINLSTGTSNFGSQFIDIENISGSRASDVLTGSEASNSIWGRLGDDEVFGGGGNDTLEGEEGKDSLSGGNGDDVIYGGEEADHLFGGAGDDNLSGTATLGGQLQFTGDNPYAGDTVFGGAGNDRLTSYTERDVLYGDEGDDEFFLSFTRPDNDGATYQIYGGAGYDVITGFFDADEIDWDQGIVTFVKSGVTHTFSFEGIERIDGVEAPGLTPDPDCIEVVGDGNRNTFDAAAAAECFDGLEKDDTVDYSASTEAVTIDMRSSDGTGGHAEGDVFTSIEHFIGSDFDDILQGDGQRTLFDAGAGADFLRGGGGTDILKGQQGKDELIGEGGRDRLFGGGGNDTLSGGDGKDILKGGGKQDTLYGGDRADELYGGGAADHLDGGAGNDAYFGGGGTDRIEMAHSGEFANGGKGGDTADFGAATQAVALIGKGAGVWNGSAASSGTILKSIENLVGSDFNDGFQGTKGNDRIRGEGGDDRLLGGQGKNVLDGGAGVDTFLLGFGKRDVVFGGAEADVFVIANPSALASNGFDPDDAKKQRIILADFSPSEENGTATGDRISLRGFDTEWTVSNLLDSMDEDTQWATLVLPGVDVTVTFKGLTPVDFANAVSADSGTITVTSDLLLGEFF